MTISTPRDRRSENIRILPVIITELEFGNIERHIFPAHFVECADHATLEDRPESFDGLSVDRADDILASGVINDAMRVLTIKPLVARPLISAKQTDFVRDRFADKGGESIRGHVRDYARNHVALACDGADDRGFAGTNAPGSIATAALIPMPVLRQAADKSFIDFNDPAELINVFHKGYANLVAHFPRGFVGPEAHIAIYLQSAHALLTGEYEVDDAEPLATRFVGVLENCAGYVGKTIAGHRRAFVALPAPWPVRKLMWIFGPAARAPNAIRPSTGHEISAACLFMREHLFKFRDAHLMDWFRLFMGHDILPFDHERIMA
jgi:hypothetical protein